MLRGLQKIDPRLMAVDYSAIERAGRTRGAAFQNLGKIIGDELEEEKEITKQAKFLESQYNKGGEMANIITDVFGGITGVDMESKGTPDLKTFKELVRGVGGDKMVPALLTTALSTYKEKQELTPFDKVRKTISQGIEEGIYNKDDFKEIGYNFGSDKEMEDFLMRSGGKLSTELQLSLANAASNRIGSEPKPDGTTSSSKVKSSTGTVTEKTYNEFSPTEKAQYDANNVEAETKFLPEDAVVGDKISPLYNPATNTVQGMFEQKTASALDYLGDLGADAIGLPMDAITSITNLFAAPGKQQVTQFNRGDASGTYPAYGSQYFRNLKDSSVRSADVAARGMGLGGIPGIQNRTSSFLEGYQDNREYDNARDSETMSNDLSSAGIPPRPRKSDYVGYDKGTGAITSQAYKDAIARYQNDLEAHDARYGNTFGF